MLTSRIIPCLDVKNGRVVKGVKFANLRDSGSPEELAAEYERSGADEIVILDVSATAERRSTHLEVIRSVRSRISIPLIVGGGVKCIRDAEALLENGADKVSVNTAAVSNPELLSEMQERFGSQCTVLALDAARKEGGWEILTHSGKKNTELDVLQWAKTAEEQGVGEILLTSFDRDGTRSGYDLELINAVRQTVSVPIIASGGAASAEHLHEAILAGADAVLAASIFHERCFSVRNIKEQLQTKGVSVRL